MAMHTTHDDTAQTWRDLTDQLTPDQIDRFDRLEAAALERSAGCGNRHESPEDIGRGFLGEARREAQQNLNDAIINVAPPAAAEAVEHWEDDGTDTWTRCVHGTSPAIEGVDATIYRDGVQSLDGSVEWSLYVRVEDRNDLTADQVRALAATLIEAADEMDRLGYFPPLRSSGPATLSWRAACFI